MLPCTERFQAHRHNPAAGECAPRDHPQGTRPSLLVLDTNVILHDCGCLDRFGDNDLAIPITVLEELDRFKKGSEDINFQAREFLRRLDSLTGDMLSEHGAPIGAGDATVRVVLGGPLSRELQASFLEDAPDHRILDAALRLRRGEPQRPVVLVTKDTNLRLKAKALGLPTRDYSVDQIDSFYTGKRVVEDVPTAIVEAFYTDNGIVPAGTVVVVSDPRPNENFILRNGSRSVLATYRSNERVFVRVGKLTASGITARNAEQAFALAALMNDDIPLVTLGGKAGSGKTLLALAAALESRTRSRHVLLTRPVVPLGNRDLGYLPGDLSAKLDPYMQPLYDNLAAIHQRLDDGKAAKQIGQLLESRKLEIAPLAFIRGRSLQGVYFIVDEAQNLTPHEVKTIITRAAEGTKIVLTGDIQQIDHPWLDARSNGLSYLINRMVGQPIYAHITLEKGERSPLAELACELL
ncbi:MAG TPA: PhoH family protein [Planctomycetaceae bacterium]|nr:PhoH family protein [Planctomycetaceae bacterium]